MDEQDDRRFATHEDLDRRAEAITRDLRDTERILRDRDDDKERALRAEFLQAVRDSDKRAQDRFDKIDATLDEQNKYIMRRRFVWASWRRDTLALLVSGLAVSLILHFAFGIG